MPKARALLVATSHYEDPKLRPLTGPETDIHALKQVLSNEAISDFEVMCVVNPTCQQLKVKIAAFFQSAEKGDLVLLYFSCHGLKNLEGSLFLAAADTDYDLFQATSIESAFVRSMIGQCAARRKLLVLDCCFAGAYSKGAGFKSAQAIYLQDAFPAQGQGTVVMASSGSTQLSLDAETEPSPFTKYFVHGIETGEADLDRDGEIGVSELFSYVSKKVQESVSHQKPQFYGEQFEDFPIARAPKRGADLQDDVLVPYQIGTDGGLLEVTSHGKKLKVEVPPRSQSGDRITLKGEGDEGLNGGVAGDFVLRIRLAPPEPVRGRDRDVAIRISAEEAERGKAVQYETHSGTMIIPVPAGSKDGDRLPAIKGLGGPGRYGGENGDLVPTVYVKPKTVIVSHLVTEIRAEAGGTVGLEFEGKLLDLPFPPGTKTGYEVILPGVNRVGITPGDVLVTIQVVPEVVPEVLQEKPVEFIPDPPDYEQAEIENGPVETITPTVNIASPSLVAPPESVGIPSEPKRGRGIWFVGVGLLAAVGLIIMVRPTPRSLPPPPPPVRTLGSDAPKIEAFTLVAPTGRLDEGPVSIQVGWRVNGHGEVEVSTPFETKRHKVTEKGGADRSNEGVDTFVLKPDDIDFDHRDIHIKTVAEDGKNSLSESLTLFRACKGNPNVIAAKGASCKAHLVVFSAYRPSELPPSVCTLHDETLCQEIEHYKNVVRRNGTKDKFCLFCGKQFRPDFGSFLQQDQDPKK